MGLTFSRVFLSSLLTPLVTLRSGAKELEGQSAGAFSTKPLPVLLGGGSSVRAASISCGGNHNLVRTEQGDVYTWGYGDMSALVRHCVAHAGLLSLYYAS